MAQNSTQSLAAELRQTPKSADYSVLRARIDMGGGSQGSSGEGEVRGRLRLISLLREKKKRSSADSAGAGDASLAQTQTQTQIQTTTPTTTRGHLPGQTTAATFRPSEPNEGLGGGGGASQADDKEGQKKPQELLLLAPGTRASASASGNQRARQLMVAPKAPVRGNQSAKQNGWQNGKQNGKQIGAGSRPGRGYESSSDDEGGRSSLGRKKARKG